MMRENIELNSELSELEQVDFSKVNFDNVEELDEVVTPGNGAVCCCM